MSRKSPTAAFGPRIASKGGFSGPDHTRVRTPFSRFATALQWVKSANESEGTESA